MKTTLSLLLMSLMLSYAQAQTKNDTIRNIDQKCQSIKLDSSFKTVSLYNEEFLDTAFLKQAGAGFGQMTGYFRNDTIYRINELYGIRLLKDIAEIDYYFEHGKLIFVYEKENYNPDVFIDSARTIDHKIPCPDFEGHYYFFNEKIIFTKTKGKQQILPNEMYFDSQSKEGQLLLSAKTYVDLLKKKKNK